MKISIALSVLIFAAAASLRWRDAQRLAVVRENHTKLVAEAATFGTLRLRTRAGPGAAATQASAAGARALAVSQW